MYLTTKERRWIVNLIDAYLGHYIPSDPPTGLDVEALRAQVQPTAAAIIAEALTEIRDMSDPTLEGARGVAARAIEAAAKAESEAE